MLPALIPGVSLDINPGCPAVVTILLLLQSSELLETTQAIEKMLIGEDCDYQSPKLRFIY